MDALKQSISADAKTAPRAKAKKSRKAAAGQKEMLLPISGKRTAKDADKRTAAPAASTRGRKRA